MYRHRLVIVAALLISACMPVPPEPLAPRGPLPVEASFGRTWDAVIDQFATKNIPIRTIERSSGLIATDALSVPATGPSSFEAHQWADCGKSGFGQFFQPSAATYNVLVRGDSSRATVLVTVKWVSQFEPNCTSRGVWEKEFEGAVKARAETR